MNDKRIYSVLTMAGVTPFVACAVLPLFGVHSINLLGPLGDVAAGYGLAIVSFLAGIHWATQLYELQKTSFNLLLASNVVFVAVWLVYALGTLGAALVVQAIALVTLLGLDRWLLGSGVITQHYYRVRGAATVLAVASLLLIAF
ncbi:MAG: DUF3429 domain-containing protein [Woeseiaceae bacterium]|nr:DUF3429 domain-containing protein [Woeseiaceae bacterium]